MGENIGRKTVGLALGGGGARGLAHLGVLKVLQREHIPIDLVAGTSMGAIIGAALAACVPLDEIEAIALRVRLRREQLKLIDLKLTGSGFLKGTRLYRYLAGLIKPELTFADLCMPLAVMAVDIKTGREVVLREGKVLDAIRASISVPGIFAPVPRGDLLLVDGGILNNVPVDVARQMGAELLIAVDVFPDFSQNLPGLPPVQVPIKSRSSLLPASAQDLMHIYLIMISEITQARLRLHPADVLLRPDLPSDVHLLTGFERAQDIIQAGEAATQAALPQIRALLG
jgi:NTE family protein